MSSEGVNIERPNKAAYYVVREIWVDGDDVVLDVQGVRGDGSYWVTGFQMKISRAEWTNLTDAEIVSRIRSEVLRNEALLNEDFLKQKTNEAETEKIKKEEKYQRIRGAEIRLV